ncbi:hypothetical protein BCS93_04690 [Vibrio breoganii]|uniref:DUF4760 domain-containing protein n=1 Tax=Vibrio breoganii TaxID=553239 RepID=A0AAP8MZL2_9VIBR|nr:hypothetical protein [Vibrio breoganii]PMP14090.1 hypothetical protein BCS93_04690 [Vibrio breoganii]
MSTESQSEPTVSSALSTVSEAAASLVKDSNTISINSETLIGIVFGFVGAISVFLVKEFFGFWKNHMLSNQRNRETMLMFMIELDFLEKVTSETLPKSQLEAIHKMLSDEEVKTGEKQRSFVCLDTRKEAFDRVIDNCHWLKPEEIKLLYQLILDIKLYYSYYETLGSENFRELSLERKKKTLDELCRLGVKAKEDKDKFLNLSSIKKFEKKVAKRLPWYKKVICLK